MKIEVKSFTNVLLDGVPSGAVTDILFNHRETIDRSAFMDALKVFLKAEKTALADAYKIEKAGIIDAHKLELDQLKTILDTHKLEISQCRTEKTALVASHEAAVNGHKTQVEQLTVKEKETEEKLIKAQGKIQQLESVLGGTEAGRKLIREQKKAKLLAAKAAIEKELVDNVEDT